MIEGEPGSGKTTFTKAVCKSWVEKIKKQKQKVEDINIGEYVILLAFTLRQVSNESTLLELIRNQFYCFSDLEIDVILSLMQNSPNQVCLIFDGLDELKELTGSQMKLERPRQSFLLDVITTKAEPNIIGITTTRSQGISQLNKYNAKAIQFRVKLCGFSKEQIETYISRYFKLNEGEKSKMVHQIDKQNLWMLASIPIRLHMMCFVWKTFKKLGRNMSELYKLLLMGLLDHMEKREGVEPTPEEEIIEKYKESILLPTAKLANRWDQNGNLIILFPFNEIEKITGDSCKRILDLGCVTRYFSVSPMNKTIWNFSHLSLQEYFVALNYAKTGCGEFAKKCKNLHSVQKYQNIVKFLCNMDPEKSDEIIRDVVTKDYSEHQSIQVLKLILDFMEAYDRLSSVNIPLPKILVLEENLYGKNVKSYLSQLFINDSKIQNMAILKLHKLDLLPMDVRIGYVKGLYITIHQPSECDKAKSLITQLSDKTKILDVRFPDSLTRSVDLNQLLNHIGTHSITVFSVKGPGVTPIATGMINKQPNLKVLTVNDTSDENSTEMLQAMCQEANKSENLREINLTGYMIDNCITSLKTEIKLTASSQFSIMNTFTKYTEDLARNKPNITKLDLSFINTTSVASAPSGKSIAQIMVNVQTLLILKLRRCGITTRTLFEIVQEIEKNSKSSIFVQELDLLGNKIGQADDLKGLLQCCPHLQILMFTFAKKSTMPVVLADSKITCLVATGTKSNTPHLSFNESMCKLEKLHMIHVIPDTTQVTSSTETYQMKTLYLLDVPDEHVDRAMTALAQHLPYMNKLEELHFTRTDSMAIKCFQTILTMIQNAPPTLSHLNIYGHETTELTCILEEKYKLQCLKKLNIGSVETEAHQIHLIRQELQQVNGKIEVYSDPEESLTTLLTNSSIKPPLDIDMKYIQYMKDILDILI